MVVKPPPQGSLFAGRYRVDRLLGHGGMGVVVGARDEKTGVPCAIKLLDPSAPASDTARLLREARALMLLSSPHVVRIFDVGEDAEAGAYLVLERLEGSDLAKASPLGTPLPFGRVAAYVIEVCEALAQAHAIGIIHRDIKPSNLFLARLAGGSSVVKVLDFGVSKLTTMAGWEGQKTLTSGDGALGSPQFISPEQLRDPRSVDARTDLWSVGVVLFRLITGTFPFEGATVAEIFSAILSAPIPTLADRGVTVPEGLEAVVGACLSRDLDARVGSAHELSELLRPFADDTSSIGPVVDETTLRTIEATSARTIPERAAEATTLPMEGRRPRRAARLAALATGVALALAGGAVFFPASSRDPVTSAQVVETLAAVTSASSDPPPTAAASAGGIELTVTADVPISSLRVPGMRRMAVDGTTATIVVAPWTGALSIEADLEGGGRAHVDARADGGRVLRLASLAALPAARASSVASAAAPGSAPRRGSSRPLQPSQPSQPSPQRGAAQAGEAPPAASAGPRELRGNPYL
jgi:eukaryotic-like serine/threonine-protein kinase